MNYARTLFDIEPDGTLTARIARTSDPITSHQSAAEIEAKLGTMQSLMLSVIRHWGHPVTANEAAKECEVEFSGRAESYRKRTLELLRQGLIEECGFRPCQITGKNAQTFKARGK